MASTRRVDARRSRAKVFVLLKEFQMPTFTWVSGRLTEVHRFINVPMRWCEQYPARERRELWISTAQRQELKLVVHTRTMPARCGHEVICVLQEGQLMGLRNLTTGDLVNFVRSDPPLLWRRCDFASVVVLFLIALASLYAAWPVVGAVATICALLHAPSTLGIRWVRRVLLRRTAEHAISLATCQAGADRRLWRVK
jgi:hypothetical protein